MGVADTVVVTLMPESGDIIQTLKAGLMEIADIYVVNKADREGAGQMMAAISSMLEMGTGATDWAPPVLATQAHIREGIPQLHEAIQRHRVHLESTSSGEQRRRDRRAGEFMDAVEEELGRRVRALIAGDRDLGGILEEVRRGEAEPYSSALRLLDGHLSTLARGPAERPGAP